jgi:hypothetical protein
VVHRVCPGPPTRRRDFDYLRPLQKFQRVWPIGWAPDRQSGQRSSILRTRSMPEAGFRRPPLAPVLIAVRLVPVRSHKPERYRVRIPAPLPWASRSTGGRHACTVQIGVQFPGGPPIVSPGATKRFCVDRRSVADRKTVALFTRVRFPPVQPSVSGSSVSGKPLVFEASFGRSIRPLPATAGSFSGQDFRL